MDSFEKCHVFIVYTWRYYIIIHLKHYTSLMGTEYSIPISIPKCRSPWWTLVMNIDPNLLGVGVKTIHFMPSNHHKCVWCYISNERLLTGLSIYEKIFINLMISIWINTMTTGFLALAQNEIFLIFTILHHFWSTFTP
jgi:hypothetical protein